MSFLSKTKAAIWAAASVAWGFFSVAAEEQEFNFGNIATATGTSALVLGGLGLAAYGISQVLGNKQPTFTPSAKDSLNQEVVVDAADTRSAAPERTKRTKQDYKHRAIFDGVYSTLEYIRNNPAKYGL